MRKEKPSKKKALFGFIVGLFEHENIELIILGLLGLFISIFGHAIYANHANIQAQFDTLAINVRDLSYADEDLYGDCNNKLDKNEILTDINSLREKLFNLIDQHASMGNLVSLETYCSIHQFTFWNDQLKDAGENVCNLQLKSEEEMQEWRDQMLNKIYENKQLRQGPINSVKEYFSNIQKNVYTPEQCN